MCGTRLRRRRWIGHHVLPGHHGLHVPLVATQMDRSEETAYCFSCDYSSNPSSARFCQNCGEGIVRCPISQMPFRDGDKFGQCPSCRTVFHLDHLDMALKRDSSCPYCRAQLSHIGVGTVGVEKVVIR